MRWEAVLLPGMCPLVRRTIHPGEMASPAVRVFLIHVPFFSTLGSCCRLCLWRATECLRLAGGHLGIHFLHVDVSWLTWLINFLTCEQPNFPFSQKRKDCFKCFQLQYEELNAYGGPDVRGAAVVFRLFVGPPENCFEQQYGTYIIHDAAFVCWIFVVWMW